METKNTMTRKIKFTPKEIEMLEEMYSFPTAYRLTGKGKLAIAKKQKKVKKINETE